MCESLSLELRVLTAALQTMASKSHMCLKAQRGAPKGVSGKSRYQIRYQLPVPSAVQASSLWCQTGHPPLHGLEPP